MTQSNLMICLNYLADDRGHEAKDYIEHANKELDLLSNTNLTNTETDIKTKVKKAIDCLAKKQVKAACTNAKSIVQDFNKKIETKLQRLIQQTSQAERRIGEAPDMNGRTGSSSNRFTDSMRSSKHGATSGTYPSQQQSHLVVENVNATAELIHRSKMAGQAMKYNNPNIADLSDENRPTKVAERYSELYDNEWTEAYEALSNKSRGEKEVIEILLCIIEEAYKYCKTVADEQIKEMEQSIMKVLSGDKSTRPVPKSEGLLLQYRKSVAAYTLGSLYQGFEKKNLQRIFQIRDMNLPSKGGRVEQYAKKAIELTWWMCVQDPPIHMCLHDEIQPSDYSSMFKAYTRSGKDLDFYVWPPIRLYKEGGLLTKGVMQFK